MTSPRMPLMFPNQHLATMTKDVTNLDTDRKLAPRCDLFSSPASAANADIFVLPTARSRFALPDDVDPYICSPSSSDDLQHMVSSVKQFDTREYHNDDDDELFVLMAPFEKNKASSVNPSSFKKRCVLQPRPIRGAMLPRPPLRMRLQKNREEDPVTAPPLKARAIYLDACSDAPKAPLFSEDETTIEETAPITLNLKKKRVHAETNIMEDQTASTLQRKSLLTLNFDDFCNKRRLATLSQHESSSHFVVSSTPTEQVSTPSFFPMPPSPPHFQSFLSTRTPNSGILCLNF